MEAAAITELVFLSWLLNKSCVFEGSRMMKAAVQTDELNQNKLRFIDH